MSNILTSWKEIAQYMGKGVRTVQRWEEQFGLPIRRPLTDCHRAVLAFSEEIDTWMIEKTGIRKMELPGLEVESLRRRIVELEAENERLRCELYNLDPKRRSTMKSVLLDMAS